MIRSQLFMCGAAVAFMLSCGPALAVNLPVNEVMSGCRDNADFDHSKNPFLVGVCNGILDGIYFSLANVAICHPAGASATLEQMVRVVVKYIDDRPERQHEPFERLAFEAMKIAWPCKKK